MENNLIFFKKLLFEIEYEQEEIHIKIILFPLSPVMPLSLYILLLNFSYK